jgi:regulator of sirC expression with transglutaminase-like and TPR domain
MIDQCFTSWCCRQILQEKQKQNREDSPSTVAGPAPTLAAEASEELVEDVKDEKSFEEQLEAIKRYLGLNT